MMVITSDTYPATRNSKAQKKIYRPHEDKSKLVVWYSGGYKGLNSKYSYDPVSRDLVLNCSDDSRSMGLKTIMAFEWALENVEFEYIIRPTPSSYINFPYLRKLYGEKFFNQKFLYAGTVQNIEYQDKPNLQFVSGSTLILNKPCVELIVENQDKWDHDLWDDLALSKVGFKVSPSFLSLSFILLIPNLSLPKLSSWVFLLTCCFLGLPNLGSSEAYLSGFGTPPGFEYILPLPYKEAKSWGVPYDLPVSKGSLPSASI